MNIEELIRFHNECGYLDFKLEEYRAPKRADLIKDVLAFANADYSGDRYIIIGVKKTGAEITINPVIHPEDAAGIQQYIHANIIPELSISYEPFQFEGRQLMVLTIHAPKDQPYAAAKDIQANGKTILRKNEMLIRKGTYQIAMGRADLDRIYAQKFKPGGFDGKLEVTFENGSRSLEIPCIHGLETPSLRNKREIKEQIRWKEELLQKDPKTYSQRFGNHRGAQTSYSEMDLPALRNELQYVKQRFEIEDNHFQNEAMAFKLNLLITNNGSQHLEKAMVRLDFPVVEDIKIMDKIPLTQFQASIATGIDHHAGYPRVSKINDRIVVTAEPGDIRHHVPIKAFKQALRVTVGEDLIGRSVKFNVTIHGSNLTFPQVQELELTVA